jgi:hypothetical protein
VLLPGSRKYSLHIPWPWRILRANGQVHLLLFLLPNTTLNLALDNSSLPHLFRTCSIGAKVLCRQSIFPPRIFFTILCYRRKKKMRKSLKRNIMEKLTAIQIPVFIFSHLSLLHLEWREGRWGIVFNILANIFSWNGKKREELTPVTRQFFCLDCSFYCLLSADFL